MGADEIRKQVWFGWQALRGACYACHKLAPGGAAMCYCGRGGGGAEACAMLKTLQGFVTDLDPARVSEAWREWLVALKGAV